MPVSLGHGVCSGASTTVKRGSSRAKIARIVMVGKNLGRAAGLSRLFV